MKSLKKNLLKSWRFLACYLVTFWLLLPLSATSAPTLANVQDKDMFTYLALGDSLTAGIGATETNYLRLSAFVPQLTSYLRQKQPVYVENHGIPGLTSSQLVRYLREGPGMTAKLVEADLITITIGGNDLLQVVNTGIETELVSKEVENILSAYHRHVQEALAHIRNINQDVSIYILDLYSPYGTEHPLHQLSHEVINAFNDQLKKITEAEEKTYLVSVYPLFFNQEHHLTHISTDDIHPNDLGYKVIFDAFKQSIVQ